MFHALMFVLIFTSILCLSIVGALRVRNRVSRLRGEPAAVRESRIGVLRSRSVVLLFLGFLKPLSFSILPEHPLSIVSVLTVSIALVV